MRLVSKPEAVFLTVVFTVAATFLGYTAWLSSDPGRKPTIEATSAVKQAGSNSDRAVDQSKSPAAIDTETLPEPLASENEDAVDAESPTTPAQGDALAGFHEPPTEAEFNTLATLEENLNIQVGGGEGHTVLRSLNADDISAVNGLKFLNSEGIEISGESFNGGQRLVIQRSDGTRHEVQMHVKELDGESVGSVIRVEMGNPEGK